MSLTYDDYPGSWGVESAAWPKLSFDTEEAAKRAYIACTKGRVVEYGSYVLVDNELRVESEAKRDRLARYLAESPYKTYEALKQHCIATGQWTH